MSLFKAKLTSLKDKLAEKAVADEKEAAEAKVRVEKKKEGVRS